MKNDKVNRLQEEETIVLKALKKEAQENPYCFENRNLVYPMKNISLDTGLSENRVLKALYILEDKKFICIHRRIQKLPNKYDIL